MWARFPDRVLACMMASAKSLHCSVLHSPNRKMGMITSSADDRCERRNKHSRLTFVRMRDADLDLHNQSTYRLHSVVPWDSICADLDWLQPLLSTKVTSINTRRTDCLILPA